MYLKEEKTLGEIIKEEGRQEGMQEGMNNSILSILKTYIKLGTDMNDIYKYMLGGFNMDKKTTDDYCKYVLKNIDKL